MRTFKTFLLLATILCSGCGTRFIVARPGTAMVTLEPVTVRVLGPDKDGVLVSGKVVVPVGGGVNTPLPVVPVTPVVKP